jgi:hypothetical protein
MAVPCHEEQIVWMAHYKLAPPARESPDRYPAKIHLRPSHYSFTGVHGTLRTCCVMEGWYYFIAFVLIWSRKACKWSNLLYQGACDRFDHCSPS